MVTLGSIHCSFVLFTVQTWAAHFSQTSPYPACKAFFTCKWHQKALCLLLSEGPRKGTCGAGDTSCRMMAAADAIPASVALAADKKRRDYGVFCSALNRVPHLSTHLPVPPNPPTPPPLHTPASPPHPSPWLAPNSCVLSVCVCLSSPRLRDQRGHWCHLILTTHLYSCHEVTKVRAKCLVLVLPFLWATSSLILSQTVSTFCMDSSKNSPSSQNPWINMNVWGTK